MKASHPENDCQERKHLEIVKKTHWGRERERVGLACSCITDVLRSRGPDIGSNVVLRDVSASLPGLLPAISLLPSNMRLQSFALMLKLKEIEKNVIMTDCQGRRVYLRISAATNCQCFP